MTTFNYTSTYYIDTVDEFKSPYQYKYTGRYFYVRGESPYVYAETCLEYTDANGNVTTVHSVHSHNATEITKEQFDEINNHFRDQELAGAKMYPLQQVDIR